MEIKFKKSNIPQLIGIEYPGKVQNDDNMIETLGGIQELSKSFHENQKLQLKFHFKNFFNKPAISTEPMEAKGILLKVKIRRSAENFNEPEILSSELIGSVTTMYKFNNFADYQFLPIQKEEKTGSTEYIYDKILPDDITSGPSWFREERNLPIFLPPVVFSRTDLMQPIMLRNEQKPFNDEENEDEIIRFAITSRLSRTSHGTTIMFDMNSNIPLKPKEGVKDIPISNYIAKQEYENLLALFNDRPIWTLASLRAHLREPPKRLSFILAGIAYYYTTGPWRNCFIKFGYDPRKHFESRFFQMLDYRVRAGAGFKGELKRKRPSAVSKRIKVHAKSDGCLQENDIDENYNLRRKEAIFSHDTIPPFRARHYQFVDIHIPKIQDMLEKIPTPISGSVCNEKRGWLPAGFVETIRDILTEIAQANMMRLCKEKDISFEEFKANEGKSETLDAVESASDEEEQEDLSSDGDFTEDDDIENDQ